MLVLEKHDLLKKGTSCFLVRYYSDNEKEKLLTYLKQKASAYFFMFDFRSESAAHTL